MLNWIIWNGTVFVIVTLLTLKWIVINRTVLTFSCVNKIYTYSRYTELFEVELIISIKMDLALNNLQRLICYKPQPTDQQQNW